MSAAAKLSQLEEAEEVRAPSRCIVLACVSCVPRATFSGAAPPSSDGCLAAPQQILRIIEHAAAFVTTIL